MSDRRSLAALAALLAGLSSPALAGPREEQIRKLETWMAEKERLVAGWERHAEVILGLALLTMACGVAIAVLQGAKRAKAWSIALGAVISLATGARTLAYKNDHHAFWRAQREATPFLESARLKLIEAPTIPESDWKAFVNEVRKDLARIDRLAANLESGEVPTGGAPMPDGETIGAFGLATPAWAGEPQAPAWTRDAVRGTERSLFVTGHGIGQSLDEARAAAVADSREFLERFVLAELASASTSPEERQAMVQSALAEGTEEGSHFERDKASGGWRYQILVRVDRKALESRFRFGAVQEQRQQPEQSVVALGTKDPAPALVAVARATSEQLLDQTRRTLPPEVWERFSAGRAARLRGDLETAAAELAAVVAAAPEAYLGWFNLALARDRQGAAADAEAAYRRALALEPGLPARDAAIYNTLGYFLYRQRRPAEAAPLLERALAIDPSHAKARNNLEAARRAAAGLP